MNSVQRVSLFPKRRLVICYSKQGELTVGKPPTDIHSVPVHSVSAVKHDLETMTNNKQCHNTLEQTVELPSPAYLKDLIGIDKYYAEMRGSELIACAATKKLLADEVIRQKFQDFKIPIHTVVKQHWRNKSSIFHPVCPLTKEEL